MLKVKLYQSIVVQKVVRPFANSEVLSNDIAKKHTVNCEKLSRKNKSQTELERRMESMKGREDPITSLQEAMRTYSE